MIKFEFSDEVVPNILKELEKAEEYIRIAVFQIHHEDIFKLLNSKLQEHIHVEIITLPYDSINLDIQERVTKLFEELKSNGAKLHFIEWNVGDPERTSTAIGRWYSFHGKFIVTDKAAISLSANFTNQKELDCSLISNEAQAISDFNTNFDKLFNLFVKKTNGYSGSIHQKIIDEHIKDVDELFKLPKVIETETHKDHWIQHYPSNLCPVSMKMNDGLYFAPFDIRGRNIYEEIINSAKEFICISTESFTDTDFANFLIKTALKGLPINILTGATSMDFADRIQSMLRDLLANNIKVKSIHEDLHGKLLITEQYLIISSINLNKINLGFNRPTKQFWRENTETISICSNEGIIKNAFMQFSSAFEKAIEVEDFLLDKMLSKIGSIYNHNFGIRINSEGKKLFAKFILKQEIYVKKTSISVAKIGVKIIKKLNKKVVKKDEFLMSLILYFLTERKLPVSELKEKIDVLNTECDLKSLIKILLDNNFIEKDEDYYKIKVT